MSSFIHQLKKVCAVGLCKRDHGCLLKSLVNKSLRNFFNEIFYLAIKSQGLCSVIAQRGKGMFSGA